MFMDEASPLYCKLVKISFIVAIVSESAGPLSTKDVR